MWHGPNQLRSTPKTSSLTNVGFQISRVAWICMPPVYRGHDNETLDLKCKWGNLSDFVFLRATWRRIVNWAQGDVKWNARHLFIFFHFAPQDVTVRQELERAGRSIPAFNLLDSWWKQFGNLFLVTIELVCWDFIQQSFLKQLSFSSQTVGLWWSSVHPSRERWGHCSFMDH